jgi:hypothetical protein
MFAQYAGLWWFGGDGFRVNHSQAAESVKATALHDNMIDTALRAAEV